MKSITMSALFALSLLLSFQPVNASHSNPGPGPGTNTSRVIGAYGAICNCCGDAASSSYQNIPNIGSALQLQATQYGVASATVEGLNTHNTMMWGGIQFSVTGNVSNLEVVVTYTAPGASSSVTKVMSLANGGIQSKGQGNYFVGTQNLNGSTQIPPGSRIDVVDFELVGTGGSQLTSDIFHLFLVGYGGVGYNLTEPAALCDNTNCAG